MIRQERCQILLFIHKSHNGSEMLTDPLRITNPTSHDAPLLHINFYKPK